MSSGGGLCRTVPESTAKVIHFQQSCKHSATPTQKKTAGATCGTSHNWKVKVKKIKHHQIFGRRWHLSRHPYRRMKPQIQMLLKGHEP